MNLPLEPLIWIILLIETLVVFKLNTCVRGHCKHGRDKSFFAMAVVFIVLCWQIFNRYIFLIRIKHTTYLQNKLLNWYAICWKVLRGIWMSLGWGKPTHIISKTTWVLAFLIRQYKVNKICQNPGHLALPVSQQNYDQIPPGLVGSPILQWQCMLV